MVKSSGGYVSGGYVTVPIIIIRCSIVVWCQSVLYIKEEKS